MTEESTRPFAEITQVPTQTMEHYRAVVTAIGATPDGLLVQIAGRSDEGLQIVSAWESSAHHGRFVAE